MIFNIGVDIGGRRARMTVKDRGLVYRQSAAVALRGSAVIAQGDEAERMLGRAPGTAEVGYPMSAGEIAREELLSAWLSYLIRQATAAGIVRRARLLIARAPSMQPTQARRFAAMAMEAGAYACALAPSDLLAALGAGCDVMAPKARLIVEVGATRLSATAFAMGRVIARQALPYGVSRADEAIARMLRARYGLSVGPATAESVKAALASARAGAVPEKVTGLDGASGFPRLIDVRPGDVSECIRPVLGAVCEIAVAVLYALPAEAQADLLEEGTVLTGGGAQIGGLDAMVEAACGIPCKVADDPAGCVARGLERVMDEPERYEGLTEGHQTLLDKRAPGMGRPS